MADHTVVGKVVRVTDRIQPGRVGTVLIPVRGGTEEFYARAAPGVAIPAGQMVTVVAYAPPRSVDVAPIEAPAPDTSPNRPSISRPTTP